MNIRGICFDMDGVIVDSEPAHLAAFKNTLKDIGQSLTDKEYSRYFAGKTDAQGFLEYASVKQIDIDIHTLLRSKSSYYLSHSAGTLRPFNETIQTIKSSWDVPLALVTGSTKQEALTTTQTFGIDTSFKAIVSADDVTTGKPDPEGYLKAASLLGVSPAECVAVEDSPSGVRAAKSARMYCIALATTHESTQLSEADRIVPAINADILRDMSL